MEEEGSGSKRSSTLPVPNPKPRPNPRPRTQVKTLASNANRNKALSSVKPSLPPKPHQLSPSSPTFTGRPPPKPAQLHASKNNNNVTQSVSNAGSRNRTLHHLSEEDDNSFVNGNKNGITESTESQRCKDGRLSKYDEDTYDSVETVVGSPPNKEQLARAKNTNEPTKVTSDLRNKPLPPRKPLPDLPGQTEAQESDSNKPLPVSKPPRLQKPPEACISSITRKFSGPLLTGSSRQSGEEVKNVSRKISAPTLAPSSPGLSPRGSPLSSPKISPRTSPRASPQTLPSNFESSIADSTGLYEIVDTAERLTTMPTTRPRESGNGKQGAAMLPSAKKQNSPVISGKKPSTSHLAEREPNYMQSSDKKTSSTSTDRGTKSSLLPGKKETDLSASDRKASTSLLVKKPNASSSPKKKTSPLTKKERSSSPPDKKARTSLLDKKTNASSPSNKKATSPLTKNKEVGSVASRMSGSTSLLDKKSGASSSSRSDRSKTPPPLSKKKQSGSLPTERRKSRSPPMEKEEGTSKKTTVSSSSDKERKTSLDSGNKQSNSPPSDKKAVASSTFDKTKNSIRSSYRKIGNSLLPDKPKSSSTSPETKKSGSSLSSEKTAIAKELEQAIGKSGSSPSTEKKVVSEELEQAITKPASSPSSEKKVVAISSSENQESTTANSDEKAVTSSSSNKKKGDKPSRSSKLFSRLSSLSMKPRSTPAEKALRRSHSSADALETVTDPDEEDTTDGQPAQSSLPTTKVNLPQQPMFRLQAADYKLKPVSKEGKEQHEKSEAADSGKTRKASLGLQSLGSTLESVSEFDEGAVVKMSPPIKAMLPLIDLNAAEESRGRASSLGNARKSVASSGHLYAKTPLGPTTSFEAKPNTVRARKRSNSVGDLLDTEDGEEKPKATPKQTSVALKPNFTKPLRPFSVGDILKPVGDLNKSSKVERQLRIPSVNNKEDKNTDVDMDAVPTSTAAKPTESVQMQLSDMEKMKSSTDTREGSTEKPQPTALAINPRVADKLRPLSMGDLSKFVPDSGKDITSKIRSKRASLSVKPANLTTKLHAVAVDILTDDVDEEKEEKSQADPTSVSSNVKASLESEVQEKDEHEPATVAVKPTETETLTKPTALEDSHKPSAGLYERFDAEIGKRMAILPKKPDLAAKARPLSVPFDLLKMNTDSNEGLGKVIKQSRPISLAVKSTELCSFDDKLEQISRENLTETELSETSAAPAKPSIAEKPKWRSRTVGSKTLEGESDEVIDNGHENVDRKFSHPTSGKTRLATRSRRLPPPTVPAPAAPAPGPAPAIPVPTILAPRLELSSPDASRRPAPLPPTTMDKPEVQRMPVRPLPALPEAARPKSVYEDVKLKTNTETTARSSSMNNLSRDSIVEEQSTYSYAYREAAVSTAVQPKISAGQQPVSLATEASEEYITPDASVVTDFVESMKNKPRIASSREYEIMAVESSDVYTTLDAVAVSEFIDGLKGREEATESSGETGTTSSMSVIEDEQGNQSSGEVSSESSDEVHEYLVIHDVDENVEGDSDSDSFSDASSHDYLDPPPSPPPPVPRDRGLVFRDENIYTQVKTWEELNKGDEDEDDDDDDDDGPMEEPLYQVYTAATLARERNISRKSVSSDNSESTVEEYTRGTMQNMRMLWCQLPEVVTSGISERISDDERKRQEAMFEVITSEASYIKSLGILINHFMDEPELDHNTPNSVLEKSQHRILFSNVKAIKDMSERFLQELRTRQKEKVLISTISDIIYKYVCKNFDVYVKYCSNQVYQERAVKSLREKNPRFVEVCYKLERQPAVQGLNLQSFLVLPMQRITRFPLLVDAICHRCEVGSEEFRRTDAALSEVNKVVRDCNEGARKMERMEEMCLIQGLIEFKIKPIALVTSTRYLLRRGDLMHVQGGEYRSPLKKGKLKIKANLKPTYLFLFSDLVLIAKKKSEKNFKVLDYATRSMTQVEDTGHRTVQCNHTFSLIFLENSEGKTKDYLLSASNQTDKTRWIVAFKPPSAKEGELAVYDSWDCPQVQAIHNYNAQQPDELTLHEGDVINVLRKLTDGWYHGERLCDGAQGWLPANHTEGILNEHVRRRNLLQRYRLLAASQHLMGTFMT